MQKDRRQAGVCSGRARGQRTDDEMIERKISEIGGTRMMKVTFETADGPRLSQGHEVSTTLTTLRMDAVERNHLRKKEYVTAGTKLPNAVGGRVGKNYWMSLRMNTMNLEGDMTAEASEMNGTTMLDRPRWRPRESGRIPSGAKSAAERLCYECYGAPNFASAVEKGNHAWSLEMDIKEFANALMVGRMIRVGTASIASIGTRTWGWRHCVVAAGPRTLTNKNAP